MEKFDLFIIPAEIHCRDVALLRLPKNLSEFIRSFIYSYLAPLSASAEKPGL